MSLLVVEKFEVIENLIENLIECHPKTALSGHTTVGAKSVASIKSKQLLFRRKPTLETISTDFQFIAMYVEHKCDNFRPGQDTLFLDWIIIRRELRAHYSPDSSSTSRPNK